MPLNILIAGGGTGGHVYPALAIAKAIREKVVDANVQFVGTHSGLECQLVPREGFTLHKVSVGKLNNVPTREKILTLLGMPRALWQSFKLIRKFKPKVVLGVGGYASFPVVLAASICGIKTLIFEPNAVPGMANRWLSKFVSQALVVFDDAKKVLLARETINVAMPVRREIEEPLSRENDDDHFHILVFGGSQGARPINNVISAAVLEGGDWLKRCKIVHQTGPLDFSRVSSEYAKKPELIDRVELCEYLHNMPERYAWADLVICRAGTGTISELAALGKPAILIPLPSAADDHQTKNAMALSRCGGAVLLAQKDLTPNRLVHEIEALMNHPARRQEMAVQVKRFHRKRADEEIAAQVLRSANCV